MSYLLSILVPVIFFLALDFYIFQSVKASVSGLTPFYSSVFRWTYWFLSLLSAAYFPVYRYWGFAHFPKEFKVLSAGLIFAFFSFKLILFFFLFGEDIVRCFRLLFKAFSSSSSRDQISRSQFLSRVAAFTGLVPAVAILHGILRNRYRYQIHEVKLNLTHLPANFKGFKIVQLSDIHAGSFSDRTPLIEAVSRINQLNPDLILFTGDLVNNLASEMDDYLDVFSSLKARYGVYSIMGNHDYGDYVPWSSSAEKINNRNAFYDVHRKLGWTLLLNEHSLITINGQSIGLIGVENWGKGRFAKYGNLYKALAGLRNVPVKILMSHDPSHWEAKVLTAHPDIDLTLSGHTHGFQFGIENKWLKWSPSQLMYPQWAGLYRKGSQYLYVNRGFGFLGYPGRIGILPEITLIELETT